MGVCSYCHKYQSEHEECFGWGEAASFCGVERPKISPADRNRTETPMTNNLKAERALTAEETLSNADWLDEAARYFEKRPTGGEDMAFWANVTNAERCRYIAKSLRSLSLSTQQPMGEVRSVIEYELARNEHTAHSRVREEAKALGISLSHVDSLLLTRAAIHPNQESGE